MKRAYRSEVDEDFHEWRKAVQAHWRHMLLVARAWPDMFEARAQLAKEMSDLLGEDHDLYVLIHAAEADVLSGAEAAAQDGLVRAARARQNTIRKILKVKGKALFAEPEDGFVARVDAYWNAAKAARKLMRTHSDPKSGAVTATSSARVAPAARAATGGGTQGATKKVATKTIVSKKASTKKAAAKTIVAKKITSACGKGGAAAKATGRTATRSAAATANGATKRRTGAAGKVAPARTSRQRAAAARKPASRGVGKRGRGGKGSRGA